jgi:uncharacterized protein
MDKIIEDNLEKLRDILRSHHINKAYVFGSASKGKLRKDSDVDILVSFDGLPFEGYAENFWDLEDQLTSLFKRKVDIVPEHTLRNPYFVNSVRKNRILIYG